MCIGQTADRDSILLIGKRWVKKPLELLKHSKVLTRCIHTLHVNEDSDADATAYEPHYDLISDPDQVQVYESIMVNSDGEVTYALLRGAAYAKDNRLLPIGFDKATAEEAYAVYGAAAEDESFAGGLDRISYQVDVKGHEGPFTVRAELLYQAISYRFAQDLCQDEGAPVESMCDAYRAADHTPAVVASAERKVR